MARPEEAKGVKAFREAKTGEDMVRVWAVQSPGRDIERTVKRWKLWEERRPDILDTYCTRPLGDIMDRGILDRKTRELVMLGILMTMKSQSGVGSHYQNAKAAGVTEEEVMEVAAIVCYEHCKVMAGWTGDALTDAFERGKNVTVYKP